ncbi:MAG: ankyrin repeat domain-containing protein, partial [Aureliella sp.]
MSLNHGNDTVNWEERFSRLVDEGSLNEIRDFCKSMPAITATRWRGAIPWLKCAVASKRIDVVQLLLELGFNPNEDDGPPAHKTPLSGAFAQDSLDMVRLLLQHGAIPDGDPRYVRYQLSAVTNTKHALEYIKLLEQHGCDLDR